MVPNMNKTKTKGIRIIYVFIPMILLISILFTLIILWTVFIHSNSTQIINEMNRTAVCNRHVSSLQSKSSKLSETSQVFIDEPIIFTGPSGSIKILKEDPLNEYLEEYNDPSKNLDYLLDELKKYNPSENTLKLIIDSIDYIKEMNEVQAKSLYLVRSYILEKAPNLDISEKIKSIPEYILSAEEEAMSADEKLEEAKKIIKTKEFNALKSGSSDNLREVLASINTNSTAKQSSLQGQLKTLRGALWVSILLIIIVNIAFFIIMIKMLILPILGFTKRIDNNERLDITQSLYEAKHLASAYNSLLDRHDEFENKLREVAELDALTGLPNRYCYNEFLKNPPLEEKRVCFFIFDINNLKYVNDSFGHDKGDELIKNASECIKNVFLDENRKNCYRIGGDEFLAILEGIYEEDIEKLITKFKVQQEVKNVSIATGYSYTNNISEIGYEKLFIDADQKMYENKTEMKENLKL